MDSLTNQPVVIDNGSGVIKAGFAGDEVPRCIFNNYVGSPKHEKVMAGALSSDSLVGAKADELRGLLKLSHPMKHGVVLDWSNMQMVWQHAFDQLEVASEEHPVLLTEAPINPTKNRERAAELFFETFNVPALFVSMQAVLSLYASGRTTGTVLDSGDGVTHAVPIVEGFAIPHSIQRVDLAGRNVTERLQMLLRRAGYNFDTSAEKEIVRRIKEKVCYVAFNPLKEEEVADSEKRSQIQMTYRLPDGSLIEVGPERFRAPEMLFNPELAGLETPGVHRVLANAIAKSDIDLRTKLYSNIVLSGGSTMFPGFGERLLDSLKSGAPKDVRIKISAPPERMYSTWIGGSILASLPTFKSMWVSADDWEEDRFNVLHRKTF